MEIDLRQIHNAVANGHDTINRAAAAIMIYGRSLLDNPNATPQHKAWAERVMFTPGGALAEAQKLSQLLMSDHTVVTTMASGEEMAGDQLRGVTEYLANTYLIPREAV